MTNAPMFTTEAAAAAWGRPLPSHHIILAGMDGYWAASGEVCDAITDQAMRAVESLDDDAAAQMSNRIGDEVNNAFDEGMSHDEWCSAALRALAR